MSTVRADYMQWAKQHPRATWDLCGSNLLACTNDDLPEALDVVTLNGTNDEGYGPLVGAIARRYQVEPGQVATATGASGANFLVCVALLEPGDDVMVETPGYDPLFAAARLLGARVVHFERRFEEGYALDPERVAKAMTGRTRLVVITNLHNPSGAQASDEALDAVGRLAARAGAHVLVDEAYRESIFGDQVSEDRAPRAPAARLGDVFITTSSLTKSYGLGGLRCGWALASASVAERIRRARDIVDGVGAVPAETASVAAFEHLDRLAARARGILEPNFAAVRSFLDSRPELEYVPPAGGTVVFPRLRGADDADPFIERLLKEEQVGVVPGRFFQAPSHFRLAYGGDRQTLCGGIERMDRLLDKMSF